MNRRDVLRRTIALAGAGTLAGCLDEGSGDGGDGDDGSDGSDGSDGGDGSSGSDGATDTATPEPTPSLSGQEIATQNTGCMSDGAASASVSSDSLTVTVSGAIEAPDPCHEATLVDASYDADADGLSVTVGTAEGESGVCQDCVGTVEYEATMTFEGRLPASATVAHEVGDETSTVAETDL